MTEETIGEALDQIVIDAGAEETIIVDGRTSPKTIYKKRTSPNTLAIQASKTVRSKAEWLHMSITGEEEKGEKGTTYDVGRRKFKRERLADKKMRAKQAKAA